MIADHNGTSIVPLLKDDYLACWVAPAGTSGAWPTSPTSCYLHAVVLEAEPDGGPDRWRYTKDQAWPEDAARYLSSVGCEPSWLAGHLPLVGPELLQRKELRWHHLTLAFVSAGAELSLDTLGAVRQRLLETLAPDTWPAPASCEAFLYLAEDQYLLLLTRQTPLMESWLAGVLASLYPDIRGETRCQDLAAWILDRGTGRGVHLEEVRGEGEAVSVTGHWGRDSRLMLPVGESQGEVFRARVG